MTMAAASTTLFHDNQLLTVVELNPGRRIMREFGSFFTVVHRDVRPPAEAGYYVCRVFRQIIDKCGVPVNIVEDFHQVEESIFDMESLRQARLGTWIGVQVLLETCSPFLTDKEKLALASGSFDKKLHDSVFNLCLAQLVMLSNQPII